MAGSGQRVLVTGAGGFIGSHLAADQAARGNRVVALDLDLGRVGHLAAPGAFDLVEDDVADADVLDRVVRDIDVVFHLAAAHLSIRAGEEEYRRVNVDGVGMLAELVRERGIERLVHCSSVGVFGRITHPPADEETLCRPESIYGRTKLAGERIVLEKLGGPGGPKAVVLRPAWVYGPGCPRTEKLFRAVGRSRFLMAGPGDRHRHGVYIRDMLDALDLASRSDDAVGTVIIVADAAAVPVRDLLRQIADLTGARPPRSVPLGLLHLAGWGAEMAYRILPGEPPLSRRTLSFFTDNTSFDIGRARRLLGYEPRYDLSRGLRETHAILTSASPHRLPLPAADP